MTRRRWIADRVTGNRALLLGSNAEHLSRVLRARVGQEFEIATGDAVRLGRICAVADDAVEFELGSEVPQAETASIIVLMAVFKFDRMEWAVEKATELGVTKIIPLISHRTDQHLANAATKRVERWRRIAHEAAQQSRKAAPPEISEPTRLRDALAVEASVRIVLAEGERHLTLREALQNASGDVALAIGPEGGWTEDEVAKFEGAGWVAASMGRSILRAETAAVAALAVICSLR